MAKRSRKRTLGETEPEVAKRSRKSKIRLMAVAAALSIGGSLIALQPSANAEPPSTEAASTNNCARHKIEVRPGSRINTEQPGISGTWSVYGDLYAGDGTKVHHWEEEGKPSGKDSVLWEFNYCGDNGWADIWVYVTPPDVKAEKLKLSLDRDYCFQIAPGSNPESLNDC
jgi:hypothetical protein